MAVYDKAHPKARQVVKKARVDARHNPEI